MDFNARFYSPSLGRFISADTVIPNPGNPEAFDRYAGMMNNPVRYNDPTGHWTCSGGNDCETWVQGTLDMLRDSGEMGRGVWLAFLAMDATEEIEIKFTNAEASSGTSPSVMQLSHYQWEHDPGASSTAVFAHEFTHMVQATDPLGNMSVLRNGD